MLNIALLTTNDTDYVILCSRFEKHKKGYPKRIAPPHDYCQQQKYKYLISAKGFYMGRSLSYKSLRQNQSPVFYPLQVSVGFED